MENLKNSTSLSKPQRNANFELLRILAIFTILLHHFCIFFIPKIMMNMPRPDVAHLANYPFLLLPHTSGLLFSNIINMGGKIGVCVFMLISGFFMVNSSFKPSKFFTMWKIAIFYALVYYLVESTLLQNCPNPPTVFDVGKFAGIFFPIEHSSFWFITAYLIIMGLSSFLNLCLKTLSKLQSKILLLTWGISAYSFSTLTFFAKDFGLNPEMHWSLNLDFSLSLTYMIFFYLVGAYFSLHKPSRLKLTSSLFFFAALIPYSFYLYCLYQGIISNIAEIFSRQENSPFVILFSISIFLLFSNVKISGNLGNKINKLAKQTLEVYLMHINILYTLVFLILTFHLFQIQTFSFAKLMILIVPLAILTFFICIIFAKLRQKLANFVFSRKPLLLLKEKINML